MNNTIRRWFNKQGKLVKETTDKGTIIRYYYKVSRDGKETNQLIAKLYSVGGGTLYSYNDEGLLIHEMAIATANPDDIEHTYYDHSDNTTVERFLSVKSTSTTICIYNSKDNIISYNFIDTGDQKMFIYDEDDETLLRTISKSKNRDDIIANYKYTKNTQIVTYKNEVITNEYDDNKNLLHHIHIMNGKLLSECWYEYDDKNNMTYSKQKIQQTNETTYINVYE